MAVGTRQDRHLLCVLQKERKVSAQLRGLLLVALPMRKWYAPLRIMIQSGVLFGRGAPTHDTDNCQFLSVWVWTLEEEF